MWFLRGVGELVAGIVGATVGAYIARLVVLETELERATDTTIVFAGMVVGFATGAWLVWRAWTPRD